NLVWFLRNGCFTHTILSKTYTRFVHFYEKFRLGGNIPMDCMATFPWTGWQKSVEYASTLILAEKGQKRKRKGELALYIKQEFSPIQRTPLCSACGRHKQPVGL